MNTFNYQVLNDKEFEILCRDLLEKEFGLKFRTFRSGKDNGIDLRYSSLSNKDEVVVQVKHYWKSSYSQLKASLKKELDKVEKINPKRYILVTSLELNPMQVDEIFDLFIGYIKTPQDILFRQTLDTILSNHEDLVKKYYKLWLTSTAVINVILHNDVIGRSRLLFEEIKSYLKLYVQVEKHQEALNKLLDNKVLIITGPPGIGKSTLAKVLTYHLISSGDFELIEVSESLQEASNVIDYYSDKKQLIHFDDFLGANLLEVINPRHSVSNIASFIQRIQTLKGKFLIMTSRTTILNQAASVYRRMKNLQEDDSLQYLVQLDDYSRYEKAKILYNHVYFHRVEDLFYQEIKNGKKYLDIIDHTNYNPRLIMLSPIIKPGKSNI